jgi:hypothetical protein
MDEWNDEKSEEISDRIKRALLWILTSFLAGMILGANWHP